MDWWDNSKREIARLLDEIRKAEAESEEDRKSKIDQVATAPAEQKKPEPSSVSDSKPEQSPVVPEREEQHTEEAPAPLKGLVMATKEVKPISVYKPVELRSTTMSADDFITPYTGHKTEIIGKVLTTLVAEAPIAESLLMRRVVQSYGIARSGSRIQMFMRGIFRYMAMKTTIQNGEKIYWSAQQDPATYRDFRANGDTIESKRDAKEIPVQEAANAICRALEDLISAPEEDLIRAAANLMGISRVGNAVYALFLDAIELAHKEGRIQKSDNGYWVLNE
jgi:hypothetical protein